MPWDDNKPRGNIPVSQLDNDVRDQLQFLKLALQQIMTFPGSGGDPPVGDGGVPLNGSGRLHIGTSATSDAAISNATNRNTGILRFITDTGVLKVCTEGSSDTWVELPGALTTALTLSALLTLTAGLTIPDDGGGARSPALTLGDDGGGPPTDFAGLIVPPGVAWLDDGVEQMNPFLHGPRHAYDFTGGNWVEPPDVVKTPNVPTPGGSEDFYPLGLMPMLAHHRTTGGSFATTEVTLATVTLDLSSRSGASSFFVFGRVSCTAGVTQRALTHRIRLDAVEQTDLTMRQATDASSAADGWQAHTFGIITGVAAGASRAFTMTMQANSAGSHTGVNADLYVLDLGV